MSAKYPYSKDRPCVGFAKWLQNLVVVLANLLPGGSMIQMKRIPGVSQMSPSKRAWLWITRIQTSELGKEVPFLGDHI